MLRAIVLLVLAGCSSVKPAVIRSESFDFGGNRATFRRFPGETICDAEPRFLLDELSSVNSLLSRFLKETPSAVEVEWTDAVISQVDEAVARLPPVVEQHATSLSVLPRCAFATTGAWPALINRANALVEQTRARLRDAPAELRATRHARAMAEWRRTFQVTQESSRRACPSKSRLPVVYFAWREGALTSWLFCDGAQITREGAADPKLEPPPKELVRGRRPSDTAYRTAAERYPAAAVLVPPEEGT